MNPRLTTRFVHPTRWAATLGLALAFAAPAVAQWKTNPIVEEDFHYTYDRSSDRCRLEMEHCALAISADGGLINIYRTNNKGKALVARSFVDPLYLPVSNGGKFLAHVYHDLVGCKVGPRDCMLAYSVDTTATPFPRALRVVRLHWNAQTDQYDTVAGFPVTVSTADVRGTSITPNETGSGIDGARVAWQVATTTPLQVTIYQQGVTGSGGLVWAPPNGLVVDSYPGTLSSATQPTSIVSTGDDMAVVTYHKIVAGNLLHWTRKAQLGLDPDFFAAMAVPGQATASTSRCCVASDGGGGAFYGYATDGARTDLMVAQVPIGGSASSFSFWNSTLGSLGASGTTPLLRALSLLAMPGNSALLVYRDRDGIRCIKWGNGLSYLWTRYVRGATLANNDDDAATALSTSIACVVTTSDADVRAKAFSVDGVWLWETHVNNPGTTKPYKSVWAYAPKWPHVMGTGGGHNPGFMLGWFESDDRIDYDVEWPEFFLAEHLTKTGGLGKAYFPDYAGGGNQLGSALLFDLQSVEALRLQDFQFELSEPVSAAGQIEIFTAVGTSHVGIASNPAAWTLAGSGSIVSAGLGNLSSVQMAAPIVVPAGTNAMLIRGVGVSLGSTAVASSNLTFALGDLTVQCGAQVANWPSGAVQSARVFHGAFAYEDAGIPEVAALHIPYGAGCYAMSNSFYSHFANAGAAAAALTGQSMRMIPIAGNQYQVVWGGGTYVAPTAFASPVFFSPNDDDGIAVVLLPAPIPMPGGVAMSLVVHSNGGVWLDDNLPALVPNDYTPRAASMLAAPYTGFWSWHDYNPSEAGSGQVMLDGGPNGEIYITWQDVESYPLGTVNRSTMQFQIDTITGSVTYVWPNIDGNSTSPYGSGHLVGYSPGGASIDGGSLDLPTALPLQTTAGMLPLTLSASSAPIAGTTVTYNTSNIPEAIPGSGVYIGLFIVSFGSTPGIDLGFLGAPGCLLHVASLDLTVAMVGFSSTQSVVLPLPAAVPPGTLLFTQSAALVTPGTLNALGLVTSNGLQSRIGN